MKLDLKTATFYENLKVKLSNDTLWPTKYLFKFIIPTQQDAIAEIQSIFSDLGANIQTKSSSKGNFTSVSVLVKMKNPDAVIKKYLEVSHIEGIISL